MSYKFLTSNNKLLRNGKKYLCYDPDAFEWHTLSEDDCTYLAQGGWKRTIIQSVTTTEENIIIPVTLAGYPVQIDTSILPNSVARIKFEDGEYYQIDLRLSNNSTLKGIYDLPANVYRVELSNCKALKKVDLSEVQNVSGTFRITGCSAIESLSEVSDKYKGTSLARLWFTNDSGDIHKFTIPNTVVNMEYSLYKNGITSFVFDSSWEHVTSWANAIVNNPITDIYFTSNNAVLDTAWTRNATAIDSGTWFDGISTTRSGNILNYSAYDAAPVTIHCNYGSAIYHKLRYAQATQNYMMRNLRLHLMDNHPIKQISFWGDSLTRRNESTTIQSNMVEHFYNWTKDDIWCWNEGHGGASSWMFNKDYGSQEARWSDDVHVIWIGTNDTTLTEAQTIENIQTMITTCGFDNNYIVLQPFGWAYAEGNEALYEAAFPNKTINTHRYIIEHGFDVLGRNPTAEEQEQLNNNTIPDVFVDTSDMTHITDSGGLCIATAVRDKLLSLGYIDNTWLKSS